MCGRGLAVESVAACSSSRLCVQSVVEALKLHQSDSDFSVLMSSVDSAHVSISLSHNGQCLDASQGDYSRISAGSERSGRKLFIRLRARGAEMAP